MANQVGARPVVKMSVVGESIEAKTDKLWDLMMKLSGSPGGVDRSQLWVKYRAANYVKTYDENGVKVEEPSWPLWMIIVDLLNGLWLMMHTNGEVQMRICVTLDERDTMEDHWRYLDCNGKMLAVLTVGQLLRREHHGESGYNGDPIHYEYVNFLEKKIYMDMWFYRTYYGREQYKIVLRKEYAWQHVIGILENRMEERMRTILLNAKELGVDIFGAQVEGQTEFIRVEWLKERLIYEKQWKCKYCLYLSMLQSNLVQDFVCEDNARAHRIAGLDVPHRRDANGAVLSYKPSRNHGDGPKVTRDGGDEI